MYRTPRNAGVLLALGLVSVSQFTWAGYKFEDGDLSGEFSFSAGGSTVTARNINFGAGVKDLRSGKDRGTKTTWQEIYVKPKVAFDYKLNPDLSLLAGGSVVAASTFGDGDAGGNTRSSDGSASVEEAYAGFRAGNWKFTAGRQDYMIGTGFIVMDGNLDTFGDGAYWRPAHGVRDSALLAWDGGAAQVQAFSLTTDDHLGDFRMNGVNLDYDVGGAVVLGATAMKVDALEGHTLHELPVTVCRSITCGLSRPFTRLCPLWNSMANTQSSEGMVTALTTTPTLGMPRRITRLICFPSRLCLDTVTRTFRVTPI